MTLLMKCLNKTETSMAFSYPKAIFFDVYLTKMPFPCKNITPLYDNFVGIVLSLALCLLSKIFSKRHFEIFSIFFFRT